MTHALLIATTNPGKRAELEHLFAPLGVRIVGPGDVGGLPAVLEDGDTFAHNARKKAIELAAHTPHMVLADDSGLEVDALGGAPGVLSARYAGPDATDATNNEKLLGALRSVPDERRTARFRCVLALVDPSGPLGLVPHLEEGICEGRIARAPRGAGGFGYDPLFELEGGRTTAELSADEKAARSHRGAAARKMRDFLAAYLPARERAPGPGRRT